MTKQEAILKTIKPYVAVFPNGAKMQPEAWPIYAVALSGLSVEEINAAMIKLMQTAKFFPTIAEIIEAARSIREQLDGSSLPSAAEAWGEVLEQAGKHGVYAKWDLSCPEVEQALKVFGGRSMICVMQESDAPICRAQFMRIYNAIVQREEEHEKNDAVLSCLPRKQYDALCGKIAQIGGNHNLPRLVNGRRGGDTVA